MQHEHQSLGFAGRYGAGLPRINDGSFLFLQHMISKMKPVDQDGAVARVWPSCSTARRSSPVQPAAARVEIRRWIIENDWLEAVVALPDQLFYNTGISTYFWIVTNRKATNRKGKVQLIDARQSFAKMRKSLGEKRKEISEQQLNEIVRLYGNFDQQQSEEDDARVKIFNNEKFGFLRITVERPLRLKWEVTDASADTLLADKRLAKLESSSEKRWPTRVRGRVGESFKSDAEARKAAKQWMADLDLPGKPIEQAIVDALATRDPEAEVIRDSKGNPEPDADLRDNENVPLPDEQVRYEPDPSERLATNSYKQTVESYVEEEVHPYVPDAWVDHSKTKIGYEVPLTRHFYVYTPPRSLEEIDKEIKQLEAEIQELLREVTE